MCMHIMFLQGTEFVGKLLGYQYHNLTLGFGPNRLNAEGIDGVYLG